MESELEDFDFYENQSVETENFCTKTQLSKKVDLTNHLVLKFGTANRKQSVVAPSTKNNFSMCFLKKSSFSNFVNNCLRGQQS